MVDSLCAWTTTDAISSRYARKIPAGSKLVFQMHYTPNGRPQEDLTQVGLVFTDEAGVTDEVLTLIGIDQEFEIPPHAKDHRVKAKVRWLPEGGKLLAIAPHMHVRGKAFEVFARTDEGTKTLLEVPRYDFNWQHTYELQEPLPLQSMKSLEIEATFDNSKENPVNPNPDEFVFLGGPNMEEMAVAFFEVSVPSRRQRKRSHVSSPTRRIETRKERRRELEASAKSRQFADDFLKKLDRNGDGVVTFGEAPIVMQRFSFWRFDKNRDNRIDRSELLKPGSEGEHVNDRRYRWVDWIVDHPRWNVLFLLVVTIIASIGHYDPNLLIPKKQSDVLTPQQVQRNNRPLAIQRPSANAARGSGPSLS